MTQAREAAEFLMERDASLGSWPELQQRVIALRETSHRE